MSAAEDATQQRCTTTQPLLAYNCLPVLLKQYGVAEAHSRPLVGRRRSDDSVHSWRTSPDRAWFQPLVEWTRTPLSFVALAFDVDEPLALELLGRPRKPRTDAGRNCAVFLSLMRYAGSADRSDADVARCAGLLYNEIDVVNPHAFTRSELAGIGKSVLRYRARWRAAGWHRPAWLARQAARGRRNTSAQQRTKGQRSGALRLQRTLPRDQRIVDRLNVGDPVDTIVESEGVSRRTVFYARTRVQRTTNTDDPPSGGFRVG